MLTKGKRKIRKKGRMSYGSNNYLNPFFAKKGNKINSTTLSIPKKAKIVSSIVLLVILALFIFLFYSSYFRIKNIEVEGQGNIDDGVIQKLAWEQINGNFFVFLPQKSINLFSKSRLRRNLTDKYYFDELSIEKVYPDVIRIEYIEKKYSLVWCEDDVYYYADDDGILLSEANLLEINYNDYPVVENKSSLKRANHEAQVSQSYIKYARELFEEFKNTDIVIQKYIIDNDVNIVKAKVENGPLIFFNINGDVKKQIEKLVIIRDEKFKERFNEKEYIDVSVGDSVYYK